MLSVLADLCIESEAATLAAMRLARAYDEGDNAFRRVATAVAKYWVCKVTPSVVGEALECLGGNGYVEESGLPRLFRESPLNSIWEGAGNVNCLDVLRALAKRPRAWRRSSRRCDWPKTHVSSASSPRSSSSSSRSTRVERGTSWSGSPLRYRPRSSSGTATTSWPRRSARPGSRAEAAELSGRCRGDSICSGSSSGTGRSPLVA